VERLWSPWRLSYVTGTSQPHACVFCEALASEEAGSLILFRGATCYIILNLYPYNNGHLMVVPYRHVASLAECTHEELVEMIDFTRRSEMALTEAYHPQGINIGINIGRSAGAGVVDHVHMHAVPRWTGDTNFMSVIGQVRVLPEELEGTAERLRPIFEKMAETEKG
jgi:ATP adenylyltransferase